MHVLSEILPTVANEKEIRGEYVGKYYKTSYDSTALSPPWNFVVACSGQFNCSGVFLSTY